MEGVFDDCTKIQIFSLLFYSAVAYTKNMRVRVTPVRFSQWNKPVVLKWWSCYAVMTMGGNKQDNYSWQFAVGSTLPLISPMIISNLHEIHGSHKQWRYVLYYIVIYLFFLPITHGQVWADAAPMIVATCQSHILRLADNIQTTGLNCASYLRTINIFHLSLSDTRDSWPWEPSPW